MKRIDHYWDGPTALIFALAVSTVNWALSFAASFGQDFTIKISSLQYSVDTAFILLTAATLLPALYCFIVYPECRASLWKVDARVIAYIAAIVSGLIPFASYLGSHYYDFPWGRPVAEHFARVFVGNLFLTPFWEEIVWRACFLKRIRSFCSAWGGILLMSLGWTIWHGGYIAFLYSQGVPIEELKVLPFTYFFSGIILGSVFELGRKSIWPCVLLHVEFNASTLIYYTTDRRISELGSYVSEAIFMAIAAGTLFWIVTRRSVGAEDRAMTDGRS